MHDETVESRVKQMILDRYGDMKTFCRQAGIPNSTLSSALKRGISNANIGTIFPMARELHISVDGLASGEINPVEAVVAPRDCLRDALLASYDRLNQKGRKRLVDTADDMVSSGKYKKLHLMPDTKAAARGGGVRSVPAEGADSATSEIVPTEDETL